MVRIKRSADAAVARNLMDFARAGCAFRYYQNSRGVGANNASKGLDSQRQFSDCWYVLVNCYGNKVCGSGDCRNRTEAYASLADKIESLGLTPQNVNDKNGPREK